MKPVLLNIVYPLITCLLLSSCVKKQSVYIDTIDFEQETIGELTDKRMRIIWCNAEILCGKKDFVFYKLGLTVHPHSISEENNNKCLRVLIPKHKFGPITGAQWKMPITPSNEYYFSYRLKFGKDFDFVKGGKLPGLAGGTANSGGNIPTGLDGWSARMMFWENGELSFYVYCANQASQWGERLFLKDSAGNTVRLKANEWATITQHITMNTPGLKNGVMQCWVNGVEVFFTDTIMYRKANEIMIDQIFYSVFLGGDNLNWASEKDQYIYFDDFKMLSKNN